MRELGNIYYEPTWITGIDVPAIHANDYMLKAAIDVVETPNTHVINVAKNGSDSEGNGSLALPFHTIGHANDVAISMLNPVTDWSEAVVIKVAPGKYTEHLTAGHRRVYIVGCGKELENWPKPVIIYNTGADAAHYPIETGTGLNLSDLQVEVDTDGCYGKLINKALYSMCVFEGGYFIENTDITIYLSQYYNGCTFYRDGFRLGGAVNGLRYLYFRNCDFYGGRGTVFGSTGTEAKKIKLERTKFDNQIVMEGNWTISMDGAEIYSNGKLILDTDGYVDIFSSTIVNGMHFRSDTPLNKKVVSCIFKETPAGEGDITADCPIEFIEYSGNHQHNGVDGEVITVSKIKNVGGGQNKYRNIHEALKGSSLTDTIINLEGDVEVSEPLVLNAGIDIQIDGNKKWSLTSSHPSTLVDLGANQHLSFVNMKQILGGKKAKVNGASASLSFVSCGRYTEPCYVNIEVVDGDIGSFLYAVKTTLIGTSAPAIKITKTGVWVVIDRAFLRGSTGEAAVEATVNADNRFRAKYSTLIHGSGGANSPLKGNAAHNVIISVYNCALNANFPVADFTNNIGAPNNTVDPQIDY